MDGSTFLDSILPEKGRYCALFIRGDTKKQKFFGTLGELSYALQDADADGYDSYNALATFKDDTGRTKNNVHQLKSFFLDLDCGEGKDFVSQRDALGALKLFISDNMLPRPTLVSSGRGIHVYWMLEEAISYADWLPVAESLKHRCKLSEFGADPAVTADGARVLRMPGTHNHKDDPARIVQVVGDIQPAVDFANFAMIVGAMPIDEPGRYVPGFHSEVTSRLAGNKSSSFQMIMQKTARGAGCAQLGNAVLNQRTVAEPLWRAVLSIAQHCSDRDTAIHKVSSQHPDYTAAATEEKAERIKGPYVCARFEEYNPGGCSGCEHKGMIKSPIVLGQTVREVTEAETVVEKNLAAPDLPARSYTIPKYPSPYVRGTEGGVYIKKLDEVGTPEYQQLYHNDIYVARRMIDPVDGHCLLIRLHLPTDGVMEFVIQNSSLYARDEFRKQMGKHGVTGSLRRMDGLAEYIMTWIEELQEREQADIAHRQFGWIDDSTMDCFILGDKAIYKDRVEYNPPTKNTSSLIPCFEPTGTREKMLEILEFFNAPEFALHQIIISTAWGAPLMAMSSVNSALFHLHSDGSGFGKTTTGMVAAGIYGQPSKLITNINDTKNSRMNRMEVLKNLPMIADEISNWSPKDLSDFAYETTQGRQKNRMSQGGNEERYRGDDWRLLTVSTANAPFLDRILAAKALPKAEAQRVIEIDVEGAMIPGIDKENENFTQAEKQRATQLVLDIEANSGHLGIEYIRFILNNNALVRRTWADTQLRLDKAAGLTVQNRFMSEAGTAILAGALTAKHVGHHKWDLKHMFRAYVQLCQRRRVEIEDLGKDIGQTIGEYLSEHFGSLLVINSTDDMRSIGKDGLVLPEHMVTPDSIPRNNLVARYEPDTHMLYLAKKPLRDWCTKHNLNTQSIRRELMEQLGAKNVRMRLTKGTPLHLPPMNVYVMKFNVFEVMEEQSEAEGSNA